MDVKMYEKMVTSNNSPSKYNANSVLVLKPGQV